MLLVASVDKVVNPLFEKRLKQFSIGGALPPKKDLHRFVRWPQVVRIRRKNMILKQRLKVPPPIHQLSKTLDKNLGLGNLLSVRTELLPATVIADGAMLCVLKLRLDQNFHSPYKFATLLHRCLNSIKKGSAKEGNRTFVSDRRSWGESTGNLGRISIIGGEKPEQTDKSMQIMWHAAHPKLGLNVAAAKPSPAVITMVISAWSFLLTTIGGREINAKSWSISYLSTLLDKDDRQLRNAAGEALALILETGSLEKFCGETKVSTADEVNDSRKIMYF
ncbi:hypothetical protein OROHE_016408 [Orobanche hederae]